MAHPHHEHRAHKKEHARVAHITKGYAHGGAVRHDDEAEDKALIKSTVKKSALKVAGAKPKHRSDRPRRATGGSVSSEKMRTPHVGKSTRSAASAEGKKEEHDHESIRLLERAKGGRTNKKGGKTVVNVIAGGHPGMGGAAPMMPPPAAAAPPVAPPAMPPRPMLPPGGPMAAPAPGMPPRKSGGRAYKHGGKVLHGTWEEGRRAGTQVTHAPNKKDGKDIGRGRAVTYKTGGAVEHPRHGGHAPRLPGGSGGGEGRLHKAHRGIKNGMAI